MQLVFLAALVVPWLGAACLAVLPRAWDTRANTLALLFTGAAAVLFSVGLPAGHAPEVVLRLSWVPALGLELTVARDGLADVFGGLAVWIAFGVLLFARCYLPQANAHEGSQRREAAFYALMLAFLGSLLGAVTAGNLLQLYFFWELTGIGSYLLIGYWRHLEAARAGARLTLAITLAGGMTMLVGLVWLGLATGEWSFAALAARPPLTGPFAEGCAALLLAGAIAKSAQFPASNWLPGAMNAPTPVSAFLHSAAVVALGVFLLGRLFPLFHETLVWRWLLRAVGAIGVVGAGFIAVRQVKVKALLAWSTVSMYAFMFIGFSLGTAVGVRAALYAFFVHAFIKAGLFLVAGVGTHLTGKHELDQIGGMARTHRLLAVYGVILGLSLGGVPLTGGFYFKEELLHAAQEEGARVLLVAMLVGEGFSLIYMLRFLHALFVGPGDTGAGKPFPWTMGIPLAVCAALALITGLVPDWMAPVGLEAAVTVVLGYPLDTHPGPALNPMVLTSLAVLVGAWALWLIWTRSRIPIQWWQRLPDRYPLGGRRLAALYTRVADACLALHTGSLRAYLRRIVGLFIALAVIAVVAGAPGVGPLLAAPTSAVDLPTTLALVALLGALAANLAARGAISFALTLTAVGFGLGAVFLALRAPDVALAQVAVEMLATLTIVVALRASGLVTPAGVRLPPGPGDRPALRLALAGGAGLVFGGTSYLAMSASPADSVGEWYARNIEPLTGADDLVVAVLTDFRGLDTLIEVLVFVTAALAAAGLYRREEVPRG